MPVDPVEIHVDVSSALPGAGSLRTAAWVFVPIAGSRLPRPTVVFAFAGGGYSKAYFHLEVPGRRDYSMARYLADRGLLVVACDHLATGASSRPQPPERLTWETAAAANEATVRSVLDRLRSGTLVPALEPLEPGLIVGLGHSLGAGLVTVQQARSRSFGGLVILGRSIAGSRVPAPPREPGSAPDWRPLAMQYDEVVAESDLVEGYPRQRRRTPWQRFLFYWDDVPPDVVAHDEGLISTMPLEVARGLRGADGPNARAAAVIDVPVLLGFGERDVSEDPPREARAYRSSSQVQLYVQPRAAHCGNLAGSRTQLWERIGDWIEACRDPVVSPVGD
jgi:pimeloyl-ACP methyl ester carboxylesterase